jgi:hypothetical protein
MDKIRTRFGIRLGWPIANAATFVLYMTDAQFVDMSGKVAGLKSLLAMTGRADIAERLIFERS